MAPLTMWDEINTGTNLPGRDQDQRDRRRRLQVPLHGQGRRLGQQELPVPGDQGAAQPRAAAARSSTRSCACSAPPPARRTTWPSSSAARRPSSRWRRPSCASARYLDTLPTEGSDLGHGFRDLEHGAGGAGADPGLRHRRPVRRQVLLPRRPGDPPPPPRRLVPGRHRRVVLGRPPGPGQDHRRRRLPRGARARPGPVPARGHRRGPRRRRGAASTSTGRWPRSAPSSSQVPGEDPPVAHRHRWSWPATSPTPRSPSGSTPAARCRSTCATTPCTTPARPRRPRATRRAPSAPPPPGAWTPTSSASRPPAARW